MSSKSDGGLEDLFAYWVKSLDNSRVFFITRDTLENIDCPAENFLLLSSFWRSFTVTKIDIGLSCLVTFWKQVTMKCFTLQYKTSCVFFCFYGHVYWKIRHHYILFKLQILMTLALLPWRPQLHRTQCCVCKEQYYVITKSTTLFPWNIFFYIMTL